MTKSRLLPPDGPQRVFLKPDPLHRPDQEQVPDALSLPNILLDGAAALFLFTLSMTLACTLLIPALSKLYNDKNCIHALSGESGKLDIHTIAVSCRWIDDQYSDTSSTIEAVAGQQNCSGFWEFGILWRGFAAAASAMLFLWSAALWGTIMSVGACRMAMPLITHRNRALSAMILSAGVVLFLFLAKGLFLLVFWLAYGGNYVQIN